MSRFTFTTIPSPSCPISRFSSQSTQYSRPHSTLAAQPSNLLSAPTSISLPHVSRWLDTRDELQHDIAQSHSRNDRTGNIEQNTMIKDERSDKKIEDAATDEAEEERCIACYLWWDLEF